MESKTSVVSWSRDQLEDQYLRLYDDYLTLKKHACKQEERIKKMATKLIRLANDRKEMKGSTNLCEEDYKERIEELERKNATLSQKLLLAQNHLNVQRQKIGSTPQSARKSSSANIRTLGQNSPDKKLSEVVQNLKFQNNAFEKTIQQLSEQIKEKNELIQKLQQELDIKGNRYANDLQSLEQQFTSKQKIKLQENFDLIRIQREVREKQLLITTLENRLKEIEANYEITKITNKKLVTEIERLTRESELLEQKLFHLESEANSSSKMQLKILELQYSLEDAKRENILLKESNEKLLANAFNSKNDPTINYSEPKLRSQISKLESQVQNLQLQLKQQYQQYQNLVDHTNKIKNQQSTEIINPKEEHIIEIKNQSQLQTTSNENYQNLQMKSIAQITGIEPNELEEAIGLIRERKLQISTINDNLQFMNKISVTGDSKDILKKLQESEIQHAETIVELEKIRKLLSVQYSINKNYCTENKELTNRLIALKAESEQRLTEYAKLLDIRASRIEVLEKKIQDLAYGTKKNKILKSLSQNDANNLDDLNEEFRGENLIEIHVGKFCLSTDSTKLLLKFASEVSMTNISMDQLRLFMTWDFYDFETQATPIITELVTDLNLTVQYPVEIDDFLLSYLQQGQCIIELHQTFNKSYRTIAAGKLDMAQLLNTSDDGINLKGQGAVTRYHGQINLIGLPQENCYDESEDITGTIVGTIDYWIRLCVPMPEALKLYKERLQELDYLKTKSIISSNKMYKTDYLNFLSSTEQTLSNSTKLENNLIIEIYKMTDLQSRRLNELPSAYFVYQFFHEPEHDSTIIEQTNCPQFDDKFTINLKMNVELDKYLRTENLKIFVIDNADPEPASSCIGIANIPLIGLVNSSNHCIEGLFELFPPDILNEQNKDQNITEIYKEPINNIRCGLIDLKIYWQNPYTFGSQSDTNLIHLIENQSDDLELEPVKQVAEKTKPVENSNSIQLEQDLIPTSTQVAFASPIEQSLNKPRSMSSQSELPLKSVLKTRFSVDLDRLRKKSFVDAQIENLKIDQEQTVPVSMMKIDDQLKTNQDNKNLIFKNNQSKSDQEPLIELLFEDLQQIDKQMDLVLSSNKECPDLHDISIHTEPIQTSVAPIPTPLPRNKSTELNDLNRIEKSENLIKNSIDNNNNNKTENISNSNNSNIVQIELHGLELNNLDHINDKQKLTQIFVEYSFLGYHEPFETNTYALHELIYNEVKILKANFYYKKNFSVDFTNNYERRQYLASYLLPEDPNHGNLIFTIVVEPSTTQSGECEELGLATVNLRQILKNNCDLDHQFVPVMATQSRTDSQSNEDNKIKEIGRICVTVRCLAALKAIKNEIHDIQLAV